MRILVAGASGALGRQLVPMLVDAGHTVTGTSRSARGVERTRTLGAVGLAVDALDETQVKRVVHDTSPEVVIHQLTAIRDLNLRNLDRGFALTNRLRTEGLDYLLRAAIEARAARFIAQSFTGWTNHRLGRPVKDETEPLDSQPARGTTETVGAIKHLEAGVTGACGIVGIALRYGNLYGPGTAYAEDGVMYDLVKRRRLPIVGDGSGIWSFIHVADAAAATVAAVTAGSQGVYNIVDDEPAQISAWLPCLADTIGAKPPLTLPRWLARPMIGELGIRFMTGIHGSSNAKAKRDLGWRLRYPSWRQGFQELA
jgi:nucleoside-diphosphate-sugar epimerase